MPVTVINKTWTQLQFIRYLPAAASAPDDTLYQALLATRPAGRVAMEALARHYIAGDSACQPPFLGLSADLPLLVQRGAEVALAAQQMCQQPPALRQRIHQLLDTDTDAQIAALLAGSACREATAAAWQGCFALTVIPGHAPALLATLVRFLRAIHLLDYLYAPEQLLAPPDAATLAVLASATILLPDTVFPLPARSA